MKIVHVTSKLKICTPYCMETYTFSVSLYKIINETSRTKQSQKLKKWSKRVQKGKKMVKIKNAHRNTIYECNFWHVYTIYICAYDKLQEFDPKYNQRSKKGKKG